MICLSRRRDMRRGKAQRNEAWHLRKTEVVAVHGCKSRQKPRHIFIGLTEVSQVSCPTVRWSHAFRGRAKRIMKMQFAAEAIQKQCW